MRSRRLVAGLVDRLAQRGVVEPLAAHDDELRVEVDVDLAHAGDLLDLSLDGGLAVPQLMSGTFINVFSVIISPRF